MEFHMDFHKIWEEQCEATRTIRERFGVENPLDYLIGEKLLNFAKAAGQDPDFAAELSYRAFKRQCGRYSTPMNSTAM
jgi:hypothetical protein